MLTLISISLSFTKSQWLSFSTKRTNTERHEYSSRDSGGPFSYSLHIRLFWCPNNVFSPCFTPSFSAWPSFSNDFNMPSVTPSASLPLKSRNVKPPQETDNSACTYTPSWVIKLNQSNFFFQQTSYSALFVLTLFNWRELSMPSWWRKGRKCFLPHRLTAEEGRGDDGCPGHPLCWSLQSQVTSPHQNNKDCSDNKMCFILRPKLRSVMAGNPKMTEPFCTVKQSQS